MYPLGMGGWFLEQEKIYDRTLRALFVSNVKIVELIGPKYIYAI